MWVRRLSASGWIGGFGNGVESSENLHCQSVLMSQRGGEFPICVGLSEHAIGLGLESDLYGTEFLKEAGVKVAGIVD
jgi:hypothetical protein